MWPYPWMYPPMYPPQQQGAPDDAVRMARRWKKFLKQEEKKDGDKDKPKPWTPFDRCMLTIALMAFGPLIGLVYWNILTELIKHASQSIK